jgi:hypothetical protein
LLPLHPAQLFNVANPTMGILFLGVKDSQIPMAAG